MKRLLWLSVICLGVSAPADRDAQLRSLANAERAFAKMSVEQGVRAAFLEFFADDCIVFVPGPVNGKEFYSKRPAKGPATLDWWPEFSDIARSGEMGYNTGPFVLTDNATKKEAGHGYFFSVWKKQPDGSWKVALDVGTQNAAPARRNRKRWVAGTESKDPASNRAVATSGELKAAERAFSMAAETNGAAAAYARYLAGQARLHRNGIFPITERAKILDHLKKQAPQGALSWQPMFADVAASSDLGYAYGAYKIAGTSGSPVVEKGHFARVWKREKNGDWRVVFDTAIAEPPPVKQ